MFKILTKHIKSMSDPNILIDDNSWDYYSSLPNPKWYDDDWVDGNDDE